MATTTRYYAIYDIDPTLFHFCRNCASIADQHQYRVQAYQAEKENEAFDRSLINRQYYEALTEGW